MPNRLIREGFLDSEPINRLSDPAECLYHRLLLAADDAGRMDGRPDILRARLYPLDSSRRTQDVVRHLRECESNGLVMEYQWDGKPFLQVSRWQRPGNSQYSKFPWSDGSFKIEWVQRETRDGAKEFASTSLSDPIATPSAPHQDPIEGDLVYFSGDGDGDVHEDGSARNGQPPRSSAETEFEIFYKAYPKKIAKLKAWKSWKAQKPDLERCLAAIEQAKQSEQWRKDGGQFIPHPATWLNQGRWDDATKVELGRRQRRPDFVPVPSYPEEDRVSEEEQKQMAEQLRQEREAAGLRRKRAEE